MSINRDLANIISGGFTSADIPSLDASKITSGTIDNARITLDANEVPNIDASKIASGTISASRLGSGTADATTFLRGDGSFQVVASGLTKLASTDVTSGTSAIVFDNSVVTAYDNYLIILNGIKTASNSANGAIMFSTDNGSSFIGRTRFTASTMDLASGSIGLAHTGTFSLNSVTNPVMFDNHNTEPLCGQFYFQNCNPLNDNTYSVHCSYHATYTNQNGVEYQQRGAVMYDVTAGQQINYFKVVNATQNIDEGRVILYGFNT